MLSTLLCRTLHPAASTPCVFVFAYERFATTASYLQALLEGTAVHQSMLPGANSGYAAGQNQNPSMSNRGNTRGSSRPNSRPASRQPSMTGNSQYPAPQYGVQDNHHNQAPQPVQGPDRNQQYHPSNQGYATSDPVDQSQGPAYDQQGFQSSKADPAIQLGAYPAGMAAANPAYGMPDPAGYGHQQNPAYPDVTYGGPQQGQGYEQQGPLGQGAQQPHSHVQYPAVLYDQQHQNYADHDPHTMVKPQHCRSCQQCTAFVHFVPQTSVYELYSALWFVLAKKSLRFRLPQDAQEPRTRRTVPCRCHCAALPCAVCNFMLYIPDSHNIHCICTACNYHCLLQAPSETISV